MTYATGGIIFPRRAKFIRPLRGGANTMWTFRSTWLQCSGFGVRHDAALQICWEAIQKR